MKRIFMLFGLLLTATGFAKDVTFQEALSGKVVPLALSFKDLTGEWRRFTPAGGDAMAGLGATYAALFGMAGRNAYYTKGETVTIEGEPFLVAYRLETKPVDFQALMRGGMAGRNAPPEPERPTPESALSLALLQVRSIGNLTEIRAFDMETEMAGGDASPAAREAARDRAAKATNLENLREIGKAALFYAQDGDKSLPPMTDMETAAKALHPYAASKDIYDGVTPNASLSGKKLAEFEKPGDIVAFYHTKPAEGGRGVAYLDGRVERVNETRWAELKKASGIR